MVWILITFMIWWDHPNLLTLSSLAYKRRGALMDNVSLVELLSFVAWIWLLSITLSTYIVDLRILGSEVCGKKGIVGRGLMTSRHLVVISLPII
jgi:hypothetical protein